MRRPPGVPSLSASESARLAMQLTIDIQQRIRDGVDLDMLATTLETALKYVQQTKELEAKCFKDDTA